MTTPHTPGKWSLPHFANPEVSCDCGFVLSELYMGAICTVHVQDDKNDAPPLQEAIANATLIADAPILLELLRKMHVELGWYVRKSHLNEDTHTQLNEILKKYTLDTTP